MIGMSINRVTRETLAYLLAENEFGRVSRVMYTKMKMAALPVVYLRKARPRSRILSRDSFLHLGKFDLSLSL